MKILNFRCIYNHNGFLNGVAGNVFFWHKRKRQKIHFNAEFYRYYDPKYITDAPPRKGIPTSKKMWYFGYKTITLDTFMLDFELEEAFKIKTLKKLARVLRAEIKDGNLPKQRVAEIFFNQPLLIKAI